MAMVRATNSLFVRRLSSQVSEAFLRQLFSKCDEVERVLFKSFPGRSTEFYAQIDFKSSRGVVEGHKLSGTPFFGVPCEVSVMDPGQKDTMKSLEEQREQQACATLALRGQEGEEEAPAEPQGVQAEAIRKYRETAEDKRLRTVHVAGLERGVEEEALRVLLTSNFGAVENLRLDEDDHGDPFALVEFKDRGAATVAKMQQQVVVDGRVFAFSESRTLINTMAFTEETVHFTTPEAMRPPTWQAALALKENLAPKIVKARAAAAQIAQQPLDEETKEQLAIAEGLKKAPEFQWAGRSEKEPLVPRRRHRSWGRQGRQGSRGSEDRDRDKKRKKARKGQSGSKSRDRDGEKGAEGDDEGPPVDLEEDQGLDLAVVPNTEVLACSSQSTSDDDEDQAPGAARRTRPSGVSEDGGCTVAGRGAQAAGLAQAEAAAPTVSIDVPDAPAAPAEPIAVQDVPPPPAEPIAVPDVPPPPLHPIRLDEDEAPPRGAGQPDPGAAPPALAPAPARAGGQASPPGGVPLAAAAGRATPAAAAAALPVQAPDLAPRAAEAPPDSRRARRLAAVRRAAASARLKASGVEQLQRWECPACGEPNKPSRELCNNCDAPAPWLGQISDGDSDASSSNGSTSANAGPQSVEGSPVRSVGESPARSVAGSGSARSISDVPEMDVDDSSASGDEPPPAKLVQLSKKDDIQWAADVVRGEMADARARIFHASAEDD